MKFVKRTTLIFNFSSSKGGFFNYICLFNAISSNKIELVSKVLTLAGKVENVENQRTQPSYLQEVGLFCF